MIKPKVSVIMPVYNSEKFLKECIESVLNQTLKDIEVICVNDGSTDNSLQILEEFQKKDSRLIIINQKKQYAGRARNNGIKYAKGKYLSFLDSDDIFEYNMLEEAFKQAEKLDADIVVFGGKLFENNLNDAYISHDLLRMDMLLNDELLNPTENFDYIFNFTTPAPWNKLFKRSFIQDNQIYFQEYERMNDAYFVMISLALAKRIGILNKALINYRTNNNYSLQGTLNESPLLFYKVLCDIKEKLINISKYNIYRRSFIQFCLSFCIYNLERLTDENAYTELYNALKDYIFNQLEITQTSVDDHYNKYAFYQYLKIMNCSPTGYLLEKFLNQKKNQRKEYVFPFADIKMGCRLILYAAGSVGRKYYRQLQKTKYCDLVAWVDKKIRIAEKTYIKSPDDVDMNYCDYIVIAVEDEALACEIKENLINNYKVNPSKIIWKSPYI